jgi:hypothetical protein
MRSQNFLFKGDLVSNIPNTQKLHLEATYDMSSHVGKRNVTKQCFAKEFLDKQ